MSSVTHRIKYEIKKPSRFTKASDRILIELSDNLSLYPQNASYNWCIGTVVDYMTRFILGESLEKSFEISLKGADIINDTSNAVALLSKIKGLDAQSLINACKLTGYDVCYRAGRLSYKPVSSINPDQNTLHNISVMLRRTCFFWKCYGPVIKTGFDFSGAYTDLITAGDGDYLTRDTLWDLKTSSRKPGPQHQLQLLVYYLLGLQSIHKNEFKSLKKLGIYNPRLNHIYLLNLKNISQEIFDQISHEVIGYPTPIHNTFDRSFQKPFQIPSFNYTFSKGDTVFHLSYGKGKIIELSNLNASVVEFEQEQIGRKIIFNSYLFKWEP